MSDGCGGIVVHEGQRIRSAGYRVRVDESLDYMHNVHRPPRPGRWRQRYDLGPDRPVPFHPKQCAHNVINFCTWAETTGDETSVRPQLDEALAELLAHAVAHEDGLLFSYPFPHAELGKKLEAPWFCALGQAFVLGALVRVFRLTGEERFLALARRTARSLCRLRRRAGETEPWVTFVDDDGYLWFEEYPSDRDPQTRILNGHIYGIMGLYSYHRLEPTPETLLLMQAGITTVRRYWGDFRRPGGVNRYSLISDSILDYLPARSVMQQAWLFRVTGDEHFEAQWRAFAQDMEAGGEHG